VRVIRAALLAAALAPAAASAQTATEWRAAARARPPRPRDPMRGFMAHIALGPSLRSLHGVRLYGGDLRVDLGGRNSRWFIAGGLEAGFGRTDNGLDTTLLGVRFNFGFFLGPVVLGGGFELVGLLIQRITRDESLEQAALGPRAFVGVDLARWDYRALTLTLDASALLVGRVVMPSGALLFGFRL
jgi:hypothetical protein